MDRSVLEMELNRVLQTTGVSKKSFIRQHGFKESTFYKKLSNPLLFNEIECRKLSLALNLDFLNYDQFQQQYLLPPLIQDEIEIEPSGDENHAKVAGLFYGVVIGVVIFITLLWIWLANGFPVNADTKQVAETERFEWTFEGAGKDIDKHNFIELNNFHSAMYQYEFHNAKVNIDGDKVRLIADMYYFPKGKPERRQQALFEANGEYLGDNAALSYRATLVGGSAKEIWIGVAMLRMPRSGPANGYWLTIHYDKDINGGGPFALGTFDVDRGNRR
ncbi:hypothetical protein [Shewanella cyperi]|uniref:Uncharacterized protein n=1 Tax=Shewanella cyperi TaxID=2814292 RepID=A0A975AKR6_9GAMM|nr:hypothetical protein [Shewanella cyperi]QSX30016.1 hypothetical protein JYB88_17870 [Shewanella cyperi]QSX40792.1 hypothetical protein JYB84_17930 [Shewanella cyperi]